MPPESGPPGPPALVAGWGEALRYAHGELWPDAESQGTTLVLATGTALWVLSRGAHRLAIQREAGEGEPEAFSEFPEGNRLWRLSRAARWRVEVALADGPGTLWSARWRTAPTAVPAPLAPSGEEAAAQPAPGPAGAPALATALARWRPALPEALRPYRRPLAFSAGVLALAAGLAWAWAAIPKPPLERAWTQACDFCAGRYRLRVTTVPAGARLVVDGHDSGVTTPGWLVLHEGKHRVDASLGEFGSVTLAVEGRRGQRDARGAALFGRLSLGCADPTLALYGRLDGEPIGRLPVLLDSVPAGRRQLSFQGRDVRPWTEEVGVVAGNTTQLVAHPEKVPDFGVVLARAYRVGTDGLKDLPGAQVWLDGKPAGVTPTRLQVPRGLHTVRLSAGGVKSPVQLMRVEGGGQLYATAEFGRSPEPEVVADLLGLPSAASPPVVRAQLVSQLPIRIAEAWLSVRHTGREFDRVPMALRAGASGILAEVDLPARGLAPGTQVSYFVTVKSDEGEEFVSEMRTVKLRP